MQYKNVKIAVCVFLTLSVGCINKIQEQEPMLNQEEDRRVELLNEDSTYLRECLLITEKEKTLEDKQYAILLNIVSHYIKAEQGLIKKNEERNGALPIKIWIEQKYDYKQNSVYSIYWSNTGVLMMPTRITKVGDRYVLSLFHNKKALTEKEIPKKLLKECTNEDGERIFVINELSWKVLMCKNSTKHIVVKNVFSIRDEKCIEYFDEFSCK